MTEFEAEADDVRVEIDTQLENADITQILSRAARDIQREYDVEEDFENTAHQRDFEAVLTAYRIATGRDRRVSSESLGSLSMTYSTDEVSALRDRVDFLEPGDVFASSGMDAYVEEKNDRYVNVANGSKTRDS